jgi:hypothetical protein
MSPEAADVYVDQANDDPSQSIPWDLLPDDSNGTWNFSEGQLGDNGFSWMEFDASRGTDYSIGQATVASHMPYQDNMYVPPIPQPQELQPPTTSFNPTMDNGVGMEIPSHLDVQTDYMPFPTPTNQSLHVRVPATNITPVQHGSIGLHHLQNASSLQYNSPLPTPSVTRQCCGSHNGVVQPVMSRTMPWNGFDGFPTEQTSPQVASKAAVH